MKELQNKEQRPLGIQLHHFPLVLEAHLLPMMSVMESSLEGSSIVQAISMFPQGTFASYAAQVILRTLRMLLMKKNVLFIPCQQCWFKKTPKAKK